MSKINREPPIVAFWPEAVKRPMKVFSQAGRPERRSQSENASGSSGEPRRGSGILNVGGLLSTTRAENPQMTSDYVVRAAARFR